MTSPKDERALRPNDGSPTTPKPLLRGRLHQTMVFVAIPAGIMLVRAAPPGSARLATLIYAISLVGLFTASATYHRLNWKPQALRWARRLDHCMIYVLIAGTATAYAVLVLQGVMQWLMLIVVWAGAILGITLKFINIERFARLGGALYIILGWVGVATIPQAIRRADALPLLLVALGGVMYTIGAYIFMRRRPNPSPRVFGYHEIWHTFVVLASASHYTAIALLLRTA